MTKYISRQANSPENERPLEIPFQGTRLVGIWGQHQNARTPDAVCVEIGKIERLLAICGCGATEKTGVTMPRTITFVLVVALLTIAGPAFASSRFIDNGNGTVTDNATQLDWQQGYSSAITWQAALVYCADLTLATQSDWRLPNVKELSSLVSEDRIAPAIDTTAFPGTPTYGYWSSSSYIEYSASAWVVFFHSGYVGPEGKVSFTDKYHARCVRP